MNQTIWVLANILLAARQTMLEKLDPPTRASVLMALLGLIILGFGLMLLVWLGGRFVRRYRQGRPRRRDDSPEFAEDAWWKKPISGDLDTPQPGDEGG